MRTRIMLSIVLSAMMLAGCTSETDDLLKKGNEKITRIYVGTAETVADEATRTATDPSTHAVTWEEGDEIALVDVSDGTYQKFVWSEYADGDEQVTNEAAYFVAAEGEKGLTPRKSYKVIYPYSSLSYDGETGTASKKWFKCNSLSHEITNLKNNDWLYSDVKVVSSDVTPQYDMHHTFALVQVNLTVEGITDDHEIYLKNITLRSQQIENDADERYPLFAYRVYWKGNNKDFTVYANDNAVSSYIPGSKLMENEVTTFWLPLYMNGETAYTPIDVVVYWADSEEANTSISASIKKELTAPLAAGKLYVLNIHFKPNEYGTAGTVNFDQ